MVFEASRRFEIRHGDGVRRDEQDALREATENATRMVEEPAVAAAAGFMSPFAFASEYGMFMRKSRALGMRWGADLAKCRSMQDVINVNAHHGERALSMGYAEWWRAFERSALWGRASVAPQSLKKRDRY